jgi:hypothetical protein
MIMITSARKWAVLVGCLALLLGLSTLAPIDGTTGGSVPPGTGNVPYSCVTRTVSTSIQGGWWRSQTVCNSDELAISAGGYCSTAGDMVGASTTAGSLSRSAWLWCTQNGNAIWYATCCKQ